jgi:hypothetical protein
LPARIASKCEVKTCRVKHYEPNHAGGFAAAHKDVDDHGRLCRSVTILIDSRATYVEWGWCRRR